MCFAEGKRPTRRLNRLRIQREGDELFVYRVVVYRQKPDCDLSSQSSLVCIPFHCGQEGPCPSASPSRKARITITKQVD
ncbi:hypothetical protein DPMN_188330 [Dreissena polymorpha]|uniref:Uncharacterized protein n=1 Tax=Dreissena polymorpha TaxID=45954 RepID=A0A9D4IB87_DREPO|nr:hypothetical protein DPMN_188330 [Dreissena polymorpha]